MPKNAPEPMPRYRRRNDLMRRANGGDAAARAALRRMFPTIKITSKTKFLLGLDFDADPIYGGLGGYPDEHENDYDDDSPRFGTYEDDDE